MGEPHRRAEKLQKEASFSFQSSFFFLVFFFLLFIFHQECNFSRKTVDRMNKLLSAPKVISSKKEKRIICRWAYRSQFFYSDCMMLFFQRSVRKLEKFKMRVLSYRLAYKIIFVAVS